MYSKLGVTSPFDPDAHFVTSPFFSAKVLAILRSIIASYALVTFIFRTIYDAVHSAHGERYFSYFTNLSYSGLAAYLCVSAYHSIVYVRRDSKSYPLQSWPLFLRSLHIILYTTVTTFPFLVAIVFWVLLSKDVEFTEAYSVWSDVSVHTMNAVFALFELTVTNSPPAPFLALLFAEFCLVGYISVAYITHLTQGFYVYSFLDPAVQGPFVAAYIAGIGIAAAILFIVTRTIAYGRMRLAASKGWCTLYDTNKQKSSDIEKV